MIMETELPHLNQVAHLKVQEDNFENDQSAMEILDYTHCFEIVDAHVKLEIDVRDNKNLWNEDCHSQNIVNQHSRNDTRSLNIVQEDMIKEEKFKNDKSHYEKVDYTQYFETTHSNFQDIGNISQNMDNPVGNIKQELKLNKNSLENVGSNFADKGNVDDDKLAATMHIKQEIRDFREQTLEGTNDPKDDSNFKNAELSFDDSSIKTEMQNCNLDAQRSYHSISRINDEETYVNIALKPECGARNNGKSYVKLENSGSIINSVDAYVNRNDFHVENAFSVIGMDLRIEKNCTLFDNPNFKFEKHKLTSVTETMDSVKTVLTTDLLETTGGKHRLDNENNIQPIVLLKRLPDKVFNNLGCPVHNEFVADMPELMSDGQSKIRNSGSPPEWFRNECEKGFKTAYGLAQHLTHHSTQQLHQCSSGEKGFKTMDGPKNHITSHSSDVQYQSNTSNKAVKRKQKLTSHMNSQSIERTHKCNICDKVFKTKSLLYSHLITHKAERPHKCNVCDKVFKTKSLLYSHLITHKAERPHKCDVCDKGFLTKALLKRHMICHSVERPHKCNVCDKGFKSKVLLESHLITHNAERPHKCNVCDKGFKTAFALKRHMTHHQTRQPHLCTICEKGFTTTFELRRHLICHSSEMPYQCNRCNKGFKTTSYLKQHQISHSTERPHKCNVCSKGLKSPSSLKRHMIHHRTEKPHQCTIWEKGFMMTYELRRHMRGHTNVIDFKKDSNPSINSENIRLVTKELFQDI